MMVEEICRCCLHKGKFKSLNSPHGQAFKLNTYAELIKDTFCIEIIPSQIMNAKWYGICDLCMMKLQDAISFKQQIILCEENFQILLKKNPETEDWNENSNETDPLNHTAFENDEIKIEIDRISGIDDENDDSKKYQEEIETSVIKIDKIECKEEPVFEETIEAQCDSDDSEPVEGPTENEDKQFIDLTPEIVNAAKEANESLIIPAKSRERYFTAYDNFLQWKSNKNTQSFSENVFLAYFTELEKKYKPSSLWCTYAMLRTLIRHKHGVDIKTYSNLMAFLKRRSDGYTGPKSKVLSPADVEKFLNEAPDSQYLATKVALIFGVTGACRAQELYNITIRDVETHGDVLLVKITQPKTKIPRSFTIQGTLCEIVKKYQDLQATKGKNKHFFQNFQKGKCTSQKIGINKFGKMTREIAKYLGLPDADRYSGHSFRRTSAKMLGDEVPLLKRKKSKRTTAKRKIENVICEICGKTVKKPNLIRHESSHNKDFRCSKCPQSFSLERRLRSHEYRCHNSDIPYTCPVCFIGFGDIHKFLRHKQSHTGEKPYKCNLCRKGFSDKMGCTLHMRHVHYKIKRDKKWCEHCQKEVLNISKHMRTSHSDARPYVCDYCGKGFADRAYLILHIRIHTGERPYECEDCGLRFNQRHVLKSHKAGRNCKKTLKKAGKA